MTFRTVGAFLWMCALISINLFFAVVIFGAAVYAIGFFGYQVIYPMFFD